MGKIGDYEYPIIGIKEAIEILILIKREKISDIKTLARKLGHEHHKSGRFRAKLSSLKQYGLITGKSSNLRISQLGEEILRADEEKRENSIYRAISNVRLFIDLYNEIGYKTDRESIKKGLFKLTNIEAKEWVINEIITPYKDALQYLEEIKRKKVELLGLVDISHIGRVNIIDKSTFEIALKYMEILGRKFGIELCLSSIEKILRTLLAGEKSLEDLKEETGLSNSHAMLLLQILEEANLLEKRIVPGDTLYKITHKGKNTLLFLLQII
ncbi:MAG: hypothetical protein DRN29_02300 [Thermoplasmata archaeon]|nr:MAG: hypothetical protein DRN29_02300 [Thermoplasmata archaeon]